MTSDRTRAIALANIVIVATVTPTLQTFFVSTERVVVAIIACRVVLDIRDQVSNGGHATWSPSPPHAQIIRLRRQHSHDGFDSTTLHAQ